MNAYTIKTFTVTLKVTEGPLGQANTPTEAVRILKAIYADLDADQEHFSLLTLNTQNQVVGYKVIASGGMAFAQVDQRLLFRAALALGGVAILVCHNHPSGKSAPSQEDAELTVQIKAAAELLGFTFLDHIILTPGDDCYSFGSCGFPREGSMTRRRWSAATVKPAKEKPSCGRVTRQEGIFGSDIATVTLP